jgi:prepilin-type N-terminal cleavage/methylation domain-containing protein
MRNKKNKGFTLIELLVVIAVIALLSSVALIAFQNARQKSRNVKRLQDMAQMASGLELYFAYYKGYPTGTVSGQPANMSRFAATLPTAPLPADGPCEAIPNPANPSLPANTYYYVASGTPQTIDGNVVYPDYVYYFCLGQQTGSFDPGTRTQTSKGVR